MTKAELAALIASKTDLTKASAEQALNAVLESVQDALVEEGKLTLTGFGVFSVEARKERAGRNPRTGAVLTIAASNTIRFRPGKMLKDAVQG